MNERIRELALQYAGKTGTSVLQNAEVLEKFAELIVRECAKIADERPAVLIDNTTGGLMKEYFGVE